MRPMLATVADRVPTGDAWVHEVKWDGMRVLVDVRDGVGHRVVAQRARRDRGLPRARGDRPRLRRHAARRRGRGPRRRPAQLPRPHRADARRRPPPRPAPGRHPAGDPHGLRPAAPLRLRPHHPAVVGATRPARPARPHRTALAGARGLRRRPPAARRHQGAGPRGHRQQAPHRPLRRRPPLARLAQDRAPEPACRSWSAAGDPRWAPTGGSAPCSSACPTAAAAGATPAGSARAWRARPARRSPSGCARSAATPRPSSTRCRPSTPRAPPGSSRGVVIEVRTLELTGQHRLRQPAYLGVRSDLSPADLEEVDDA